MSAQGSRPAPRGVALINALIVVAALSAISVALLSRANQAGRDLAALDNAAQLGAYLDGAELLMVTLFAPDRDATAIHPGQIWAQPGQNVPIDRGVIDWRLSDLQGRFNVNWLAHDSAFPPELVRQTFAQLAQSARLRPEVSRRLTDALDPESGRRAGLFGRLGQPPPMPLVDVAQLRLVEGVAPEDLDRLSPFLAALPPDAELNVNTATPEVLGAVLSMSPAQITARLPRSPFQSVADFLDWAEGQPDAMDPQLLAEIPFAVGSEWFEADLRARLPALQERAGLDMHEQRRRVVFQLVRSEGRAIRLFSVPGFDQ